MIVYTKVLIAAINLMKMTGPIKAEMKVLDVTQNTGNTWVIVPGKLARQSKGKQSLFWNSRKGHALVQVDLAESVEDRTSYQVAKVLFDRGIT